MQKTEIRKKILAKRNRLSKKHAEDLSKKIFQKLKRLKEFKKAGNVFFYLSKDNEIATRPAIIYSLKNKKRVSIPKMNTQTHTFHPVLIKDLDKDLCKGPFGLEEPITIKNRRVTEKEIDLTIVPGIAFDKAGTRLGFGKGYYDKFLEKRHKYKKIALAYDFQIVPELPKDTHDVPVDIIVTEERIIRLKH